MSRRVALKWAVALVALAIAPGAPAGLAAEGSGTVRGVVKSSAGQPLSGAYVKLANPQMRLIYMVISQAQGRYSAENLPAGEYTVQGIGGGMQSEPKAVNVEAAKTATADVSLTAPQPAALPNGWPARPGKVGGVEMWVHEPQTPLADGEGKSIMESKCKQCHETERIVLLRMNHEKWEFTIDRMRSYIADGKYPPLTDQEARTVVEYLTKNYSGQPGTRNAFADPNSRLPRTLLKGDAANYIAMDYKLPENPERDPHDLTVDNMGNAWMSDRQGCCLNRYNPRTHEFTTFTPPPAAKRPRIGGSIARASGNSVIWIQDNANRRWLSFDTKTEQFTAYPVPASVTGPTGSNTIIEDGKGILWGAGNQQVLGLEPKTGKFVAYDIPYWVKNKQSANGYGVAIGGDGKVWFAERDHSLIGRLDPATGKIDEFETPIAKSIPRRMGSDPTGNIWVGLHEVGKLMKIDHQTVEMSVYDPPTKDSAPYSVTSDPRNGIIWFSEQGSDKIGRFDPKTRVFTEFSVPTAESDMRRIELDPTNPDRIWWAGDTVDRIGYIEILKQK